MAKRRKLKIMVSSTVYGAESDLDQVGGILRSYGYDVIMSKEGSVFVPIGASAEEACLKAVEDCDLFLGIVFPRYGSGITNKEFLHAITQDKPRWFIAHQYVTFARDILKQYMFTDDNQPRPDFKFRKTALMDSAKVIDMYNLAIQNHLPFEERKSNWAQPFFKIDEVMVFLETQFRDIKRRRMELENLNAPQS
jgi:Domain of unknown function (DUF4062)